MTKKNTAQSIEIRSSDSISRDEDDAVDSLLQLVSQPFRKSSVSGGRMKKRSVSFSDDRSKIHYPIKKRKIFSESCIHHFKKKMSRGRFNNSHEIFSSKNFVKTPQKNHEKSSSLCTLTSEDITDICNRFFLHSRYSSGKAIELSRHLAYTNFLNTHALNKNGQIVRKNFPIYAKNMFCNLKEEESRAVFSSTFKLVEESFLGLRVSKHKHVQTMINQNLTSSVTLCAQLEALKNEGSSFNDQARQPTIASNVLNCQILSQHDINLVTKDVVDTAIKCLIRDEHFARKFRT